HIYSADMPSLTSHLCGAKRVRQVESFINRGHSEHRRPLTGPPAAADSRLTSESPGLSRLPHTQQSGLSARCDFCRIVKPVHV
ncbi:hypothetical protein KUCAC02_001344, partial [Chaenocephalus aceratus]